MKFLQSNTITADEIRMAGEAIIISTMYVWLRHYSILSDVEKFVPDFLLDKI
ncbi:MAG: hypothetical protein HUU08_13950 [Candidatus Brocadia sp.]|nr:hypothetical protein [Candidatus Brocadia sp.]